MPASFTFLQQLAVDQVTGILYDAVSDQPLLGGFSPGILAALQSNSSGNAFAPTAQPYKYTGTMIDVAADGGGTGNAVAPTLPTVPADAVGMELWVNGNAADDYLFVTTFPGRIGSLGNFAANIAANVLVNRYVINGKSIVVPFQQLGVLPSLRIATGKASARMQGQYISQSSGFPYLLSAPGNEGLASGAGANFQFPYNVPASYPTGSIGFVFQLLGAGTARMATDGTVTTATVGRMLSPGTYYIDSALSGISFAATRIFLPAGLNICYSALMPNQPLS